MSAASGRVVLSGQGPRFLAGDFNLPLRRFAWHTFGSSMAVLMCKICGTGPGVCRKGDV